MSREKRHEDEVQGLLFRRHISFGGVTDPELADPVVIYEPVPGGFYPDAYADNLEKFRDPELLAKIVEDQKSRKHRSGQLGKHSPLARDGSYKNLRVGDFLPGFGPVTYTNIDAAHSHADVLEDQRLESSASTAELLRGIIGVPATSLGGREMPNNNLMQASQELSPAAHRSERLTRIALVHVLTPEFNYLNPDDFADISNEVVERASPQELRMSLLDTGRYPGSYIRGSENVGTSTVAYRSGDRELSTVWLTVTPEEFGLFSRHVPMLGKTAFNSTLTSRDRKLREQTGDPTARARSDEDLAAAGRAAVRQVSSKLDQMTSYLSEEIQPRITTVEKFTEMTKHRNLNRGSHETVQDRFEHLRLYVFGDMLDAVGNQRGWTARQAERAQRILQKRLYISGSPADRVSNFKAMLELAQEYYAHKEAFVLTRIADTERYLRQNRDIVYDIQRIDQERKDSEEG